jgi:hypothetical protein
MDCGFSSASCQAALPEPTIPANLVRTIDPEHRTDDILEGALE